MEFLQANKNTKWFLLQAAGRIFDPLGLLSPYTICFKLLFQELWLRKLSWDSELPADVKVAWKKWCSELTHILELQIPRFIFPSSNDSHQEVELHTFADASPRAYGAAAYLKVKNDSGISVNLIASKNRVVPLKKVSLPRRELLRTLIAARLSREVSKILGLNNLTTVFWTYSSIALFWIKDSSQKLENLSCHCQ